MNLELLRFAYTPTETQGRLFGDGFACYTIEQPWQRGEHPGGKPFESCIPDGEYELVPFERPSGARTFAIVNESLGVHLYGQRGDPYRFLCLLHSANYVDQVKGCIAPGHCRRMKKGRIMVTESRKTMNRFRDCVPWTAGHTLTIKPALGAVG